MKVFDLFSWFRQLPRRNLHRWMAIISFMDLAAVDASLGMGQSDSADWEERISLILAVIVLHELDKRFEADFGTNETYWCRRLRAYRLRRLNCFGGDVRQARPYSFIPFQDDYPLFIIAPLRPWAETIVSDIWKFLGIVVSEKTKPGSISNDAIGATFSFAGGNLGYGPLCDFTSHFRASARNALKHRNISLRKARTLAGQQAWANHFFADGAIHCIAAHRNISQHERDGGEKFYLSPRWRKDLRWTMSAAVEPLRAFFDNPCFAHGGNVAGDASTLDGWGFHIGPVYASGLWDDETLSAIARSTTREFEGDRISISPLELWVQALISHALGLYLKGLLDGKGQFVSCCDNEASCIVVDTLRPKSAAMLWALSIKLKEEKQFSLRGKLQHIPGDSNIISDYLSHNRICEAVQILRSKWGQAVKLELSPVFLADTLSQLRSALPSIQVGVFSLPVLP